MLNVLENPRKWPRPGTPELVRVPVPVGRVPGGAVDNSHSAIASWALWSGAPRGR